MSIDNLEFIERQNEKNAVVVAPKGTTLKQAFISVIFVCAYVVICAQVAIFLNIDKATFVLAALLFVISGILAFWGQRFLHRIRHSEKERLLVREVLEGSRGARMITDCADNTIYYNQRFAQLCKDEETIDINALANLFIKNNDAYQLFQKLSEQARLGMPDSMELRAGKGNKAQWFLVTAQPVAGWAGYVHWRVDDVTQQRDTDRSVMEEREKLIDFTDNAPVGFFSVDENGRFIFVNATLARWLGNDIQSLLNKGHLHTYIENPPQDAAPYDVVEKGGARQVTEIMMKGPGGRTFLASVNQAVVAESGGRVRTRGVVHDLTSEREMHQALKASEDRFQRFFDEAPLGILRVDAKGLIEDCNNAFALLTQGELEDIEGKNFKDFIAPHNRSVLW